MADVEMAEADVEEVKAVLRNKLSAEELRLFRGADYDRLASNGFLTAKSFEDATREDLKDALPGRAALVALLLKAFARTREPVSASSVDRLVDSVWENIQQRLPDMRLEKDFKSSYHRSTREICTIDGKPVLLLQGLKESEFFSSSAAVLRMFTWSQTELCFLVDASGSGKTRTLYEICCQRQSIFLTGVSSTGAGDEGSRDLFAVSSALQRLYPLGEIPDTALQACLAAVFISRLSLLKKAKSVMEVSPLTWLFKQVYFRTLNYPYDDPWLFLTRKLLELIRTAEDVSDVHTVFLLILHKLRCNVGWDKESIVVIDECQEISRRLENRFRSELTNRVEHSMLDGMFLALRSLGFRSIVLSGTGRHLIRMINNLTNTVKDRLDYFKYTTFGEFDSVESIEAYTKRILEKVDDFDFPRIFGLFPGRYRMYVTILQMFIRTDREGLTPTDFFLEKAELLCSVPGNDPRLGINRSIWDDVVKFFEVPTIHPSCFELVTTLLLLEVFTGVPVKLAVFDKDLELVQVGIGRMITKELPEPLLFKSGMNLFPVAPDGSQDMQRQSNMSLQTVEIGEPLVVKTLWTYLTKAGVIQQKLINDMGVSSESQMGIKFEAYSIELLTHLLEKQPPVNYVPNSQKNKLAEIYKQPLSVPKPRTPGVITWLSNDDHGRVFLEWLNDFEQVLNGNSEKMDTFRPFLHSGGDTTFGPDMVAAAITEVPDKDKKLVKVPIFSLFQHKVNKNQPDMTHALATLDTEDLYLHKKTQKRTEGQERAVQKFHELLAKGGILKWVICLTSSIGDLTSRRIYEAAYAKVPEIHKNKRVYEKLKKKGLVGIVDKNFQIMSQEDEWFVKAVQCIKESM